MSTTINDGKVAIYCNGCAAERLVNPTPKGNPRPPRGWRVVGAETLCPDCFGERYQTVAVTLPVIGTKDAWAALSPEWRETTALANWAMDRMIASDVVVTPDMEKLPKREPFYLYGAAKAEYHRWGRLPAAASLAVLNRVEQDWKNDRYQVLWTNERARRTYQYPQPFSTGDFSIGHVQHENEERLAVTARVGNERRSFVLSRAKGFRRQRKTLEQVLASGLGAAACTELTFSRRRTHEGDHRPDVAKSGKRWRIMAKICVLIEKKQRNGATGTLYVKTHPESLIEALDTKGERIWWLHADHARRIVSKHEDHLARLQRLADDRKHEKRKPKRQGLGFREMLRDVSGRDSRRIQQIADEVAASTVAFASRRRYAVLEYDDTQREFAHNFRWAMLKVKLASKCKLAGIEFRERSSGDESSATARSSEKRSKSNA